MDRGERKAKTIPDNAPKPVHELDATHAEVPTFSMPRPGRTLAALTTSALALPGIATPARADAPIERATASSATSYYFEDDIDSEKFLDDGTGSQDRYEIITQQLRFDLPVSERIDLGIDFLYEEMSGASPWFVVADPNRGGQEVQVMSGATIEDERIDATVDLDFYLDSGKDTFSTGFSIERDYTSMHFGLGSERNFNDKNTVLNLAGAFSYDWIEPTDADLFSTRPEEETKWTIDLFAGLSQILTRASTAQVTVNYKHSDGYLSDPYKAVTSVDDAASLISDSRPDSRDQVTVLARYRHHIELLNASAHVDYQFHADDWGIVSHAAEIAWYQSFLEYFTFAPGIRWYSQSQADFYEAVLPFATLPAERSSDYRLSPYGALSIKAKFDVEIIDLFEYSPPRFLEAVGITEGFDMIATISYERYFSDGDIGLRDIQESDEAPGLVAFHIVAFTLNGRF